MPAESLTTQNYLKTIYAVCAESKSDAASTGELARLLGVAPGTVTGALQRMAEADLVDYRPHQGASLTDSGEKIALKMIRRHRLLELFLVKTLGMPWDEVHQEAENLEHAVSDRLIDLIDGHLGYPSRDPHGDPIPNPGGDLRADEGEPLSEFPVGHHFEVVRVLHETHDFLKYLEQTGLVVGVRGEVLENQPVAGIMAVSIGPRRVTLSAELARQLFVLPLK